MAKHIPATPPATAPSEPCSYCAAGNQRKRLTDGTWAHEFHEPITKRAWCEPCIQPEPHNEYDPYYCFNCGHHVAVHSADGDEKCGRCACVIFVLPPAQPAAPKQPVEDMIERVTADCDAVIATLPKWKQPASEQAPQPCPECGNEVRHPRTGCLVCACPAKPKRERADLDDPETWKGIEQAYNKSCTSTGSELFNPDQIEVLYKKATSDDERTRLFAILPYAQEIEYLRLELQGWAAYGSPGKGKRR